MASKPPGAGAVSGIAEIVEQLFGVPLRPTILRSDALAQLHKLLGERKVTGATIELSDEPVSRGMLFDAAGRRVEFPPGPGFDRAYVALVNLEPLARWAHPAYWAFISSERETPIEIKDTNVPESLHGAVRLLPEGEI